MTDRAGATMSVIPQTCACGDNKFALSWDNETHLWQVKCSLCRKIYSVVPNGYLEFIEFGRSGEGDGNGTSDRG